MNVIEITPGAVAAALWEAIKWIIRTIKKDPFWSVPVKLEIAAVAILAFLCTPLLALLGMADYQFPSSLEEFGRAFVILLLQVLVALVTQAAIYTRTTKKARDRYLAERGPKGQGPR